MNSLREFLEKNDVKLKSCKYVGKVKILDTNKGKLVYKENCHNKDIYEYLKTRDFHNYPQIFNSNYRNVEVSKYIEEKDVAKEQRLSDLIRLSANLHRKTTFNKEIDLDELKKKYEDILKQANYLRNYYEDLNNYIDTQLFMSPSEYLLVSNIDLIYYCLDFVRIKINNWYNNIKEKKTIRYSMIHNNLSLDHLLESDSKYLISWSKSRLDMPIFDLIKIYQDNYYDLSLDDLFQEYEHDNHLQDYEYLFLLINLALVKKIEFTKDTYQDCCNINKYLIYLRKIATLIHKKNDSYKKI